MGLEAELCRAGMWTCGANEESDLEDVRLFQPENPQILLFSQSKSFLALKLMHHTVLMIGSVPGPGPKEVIVRLLSALPGLLKSVPDGETGKRNNYIGWQRQRFPIVALHHEMGGTPLPEGRTLSIVLEDIQPTEYDTAAISSYEQLIQLRQKSIISEDVVFQI